MKPIYCDNSSTTKIYPEVIKEIDTVFQEVWGNPSSIHTMGRYAKNCITSARKKISEILNCSPEEIYFTSGGSESDNIFIKGCFKEDSAIITSGIEHPAVLNACKSLHNIGCLQITLPVNKDGIIDLKDVKKLETLFKREKPIFATVMYVNNETGKIQPIKEICSYLKSILPNIIFHTDAVQAVGKVPLDVKELGVDSMSLSGHKFGAPKGIGILYLKNGIKCYPLIDGGGQENKLRSGTENVPYIMGIAKALDLTYRDFDNKLYELATFDKAFCNKLKEIPEAKLNVTEKNKAYGIHSVCFKGINAQNLLIYLDNRDIYISAGSACHSDDDTPSYVLKAMKMSDEDALSTLRFSFKEPLEEKELDYLIESLKNGIKLQKKYLS